MAERRALVVSYHEPQLDRDSGARRIFHFIEMLQSSGWTVSFLASDGILDMTDVRVLQRRGVAVWDGQQQSIAEVLDHGPFDLALIAFWLNAERYIDPLRRLSPETRVIVDSVDLHFLRESRKAFKSLLVGESGGLTGGHAARLTGELNTYAAADRVLTVSQKEADLLDDLVAPGLAACVPDHEEMPASRLGFEERQGIACIGSFEHPPNIEAVAYLCNEVVPLIDPELLEQHPIYVIGNAMTETVRDLGRGLPHVRMVGWVPSVRPYLERSRISVVPLLYGAGTKRKLIQALTTGTPTVSTSIGVEGLELKHEEHVLIADDPASFAADISRLLEQRQLWQRLAKSGRARIRKTSSLNVARSLFEDVVEKVMSAPPKGRLALPADETARVTVDQYREVVDAVREAALSVLPKTAHLLVVSRGDERLTQLDGLEAWHFPRDKAGRWAGFHPASSAEAIEHLEELRTLGVDHFLIPQPSMWWLQHYADLRDWLEGTGTLVHQDHSCVIFRLPETARVATVESLSPRPVRPPIETSAARSDDARLIAFYLPQFHPIPENDRWWGNGFTEWRNVAAARPRFAGHYQPHVPADHGFYDLRLRETREAQAELARAHGIHGFCYYHYWFDSTRLLERPFEEVLRSGAPDLPFALCWANDPWSRRWDGRNDDLLQAQTYSPEDDVAHIRWLLDALGDPRAITVEGKPMFLVYRASDLPDPTRTTDIWRREVDRAGLPGIHLVAVETAWELGWDATKVGFDAKVLFQPQFGWLMTDPGAQAARIEVPGKDELQVYDYDGVRAALANLESVPYRRYESVVPGWDNTARVGDRGVVLHNSTPAGYQAWLEEAVARASLDAPEHRLVFINAWNEWAEGCHLEPDLRFGHEYLEATRRAVLRTPKVGVGT